MRKVESAMVIPGDRIDAAALENRPARSDVSLTCEIRQGMRPWAQVKLHDISATGFRIDWRPGLDERNPLNIRIPGLQMLISHLRWKRDNWIGCEFTHPLYPPVFEHIVRNSQHQAQLHG